MKLTILEILVFLWIATIYTVPPKTDITRHNDNRPVALTSVVMNVFEHLVIALLKAVTNPPLHPLQFAYRANRSVHEVVNLTLQFMLQHLDSPGMYTRVLHSKDLKYLCRYNKFDKWKDHGTTTSCQQTSALHKISQHALR